MEKVSEQRWADLRELAAKVDPFAAAIQAARVRTSLETIGAQVEKGRTRIVHTIYPENGGFAKIVPITGWLSHENALSFVNAL